MDSNGGAPQHTHSKNPALHAQLDTARQAMLDAAQLLRVTNDSDAEDLIPTAREIQHLTDALLATLVRLAANDGTSAPLETLLGDNGTVPRHQVRNEIERGRVLGDYPTLANRWSSGETPTANVDVLARVTAGLDEAETEAFKQHDTDLADAAARLSEESFRKRTSRLRDKIRLDGGASAAAQVVNDSFVKVTPARERNAYRMAGFIDPLRGAAINAAIQREAKCLADHPALSEGMTPAQLSAQALHDLVLRGDSMDRTSRPRASIQLNVLCDRDTLATGPHENTIAETHEGLSVGTATIGRLCCDATLRRIDAAPDGDVHVSRTSRAPSHAQRMALRALYPSCPISGAGWEHIEIHHVVFFSESKRTVLSELVPISRRWHHLIHDEGWSLTMDPDRTLHLSRPDGTHFRTINPPTPINVSPSADDSVHSAHRKNNHTLAA